MGSLTRRPLFVFAQVPPPEHGQSRMVAAMLETLEKIEGQPVFHVNARFSLSFDEIGEGSLIKVVRSGKYLYQALRVRCRLKDPVLYYIPGPVKWSAVARDWFLLGILRLAYRRVVFHWHAIGQGEWAHGSDRLDLAGPRWLVGIGRWWSRKVLEAPDLSIVVSPTSRNDADAVGSRRVEVVPNGIPDPPRPPLDRPALSGGRQHWLFLSRGNRDKGLFDLLEAVRICARWGSVDSLRLTVAGGIAFEARDRFEELSKSALDAWEGRLEIRVEGFIDGEEKWNCYREADLFLAPSRWESFGLVVAEAMAMRLPVVAAACDGIRGVLPADYPYLAKVGDPADLAVTLCRASDALVRGEGNILGRKLRQRFEENFRFEQFERGVASALTSLSGPEADELGKNAAPLAVTAYLADQNPKLGRSLGISRMTEVVLGEIGARSDTRLIGVESASSVRIPNGVSPTVRFPWSTRAKMLRIATDHLHPLMLLGRRRVDVWYYPKGFMPKVQLSCQPAVATIHDTIIQYYQDHYPKWRLELEYSYWAGMLVNTLRHATAIMTVSENAKEQILDFMRRHDLPEKEIAVTYEPCLYEKIPQPEEPSKADYVLHLGSKEPHKRTAWLIRKWAAWSREGREWKPGSRLPKLHIVGSIPDEVGGLAKSAPSIVYLPFLEDQALVSQFLGARALLFPSEVEGFGLPAIEAYYLGTPVCFHFGTSVEEVLGVATAKGGFDPDDPEGLLRAFREVMEMTPGEIRECGLKLRETYSSERVVERMMEVFREVRDKS